MQRTVSDDPKPRRPITDSPWFWAYLFCTGGLVALVAMGPKFGARQVALERQYQGRERAIERKLSQTPSTEMSTQGSTVITLKPLYLVLGGALVVAWSTLWWTHFRRPAAATRRLETGTSNDQPETQSRQTPR